MLEIVDQNECKNVTQCLSLSWQSLKRSWSVDNNSLIDTLTNGLAVLSRDSVENEWCEKMTCRTPSSQSSTSSAWELWLLPLPTHLPSWYLHSHPMSSIVERPWVSPEGLHLYLTQSMALLYNAFSHWNQLPSGTPYHTHFPLAKELQLWSESSQFDALAFLWIFGQTKRMSMYIKGSCLHNLAALKCFSQQRKKSQILSVIIKDNLHLSATHTTQA